MTQQTINIGTTANDGTGDDLRTAMQKVNLNFTELYGASPLTSSISIEGNHIYVNDSNANLKLSASGTGAIELEGIQIRDNRIEATRSNDDLVLSASGTGQLYTPGNLSVDGSTYLYNLSSTGTASLTTVTVGGTLGVTGTLTAGTIDVNVLQSTDSTAIQINEGLNVSGTLSANTIDTNTISSSDSTAIQIDDGVNISGTLSANTIDTNTISSSDSSAVTIADNLQVNGTLTATSISGVAVLNNGDISDSTATVSSSSATAIDSFAVATYRSAKYFVSITDSTNSLYELQEANVMHDGSTAYISSHGSVTNHTGSIANLTADISGGNVRLLLTPNTEASLAIKITRIAIDV